MVGNVSWRNSTGVTSMEDLTQHQLIVIIVTSLACVIMILVLIIIIYALVCSPPSPRPLRDKPTTELSGPDLWPQPSGDQSPPQSISERGSIQSKRVAFGNDLNPCMTFPRSSLKNGSDRIPSLASASPGSTLDRVPEGEEVPSTHTEVTPKHRERPSSNSNEVTSSYHNDVTLKPKEKASSKYHRHAHSASQNSFPWSVRRPVVLQWSDPSGYHPSLMRPRPWAVPMQHFNRMAYTLGHDPFLWKPGVVYQPSY